MLKMCESLMPVAATGDSNTWGHVKTCTRGWHFSIRLSWLAVMMETQTPARVYKLHEGSRDLHASGEIWDWWILWKQAYRQIPICMNAHTLQLGSLGPCASGEIRDWLILWETIFSQNDGCLCLLLIKLRCGSEEFLDVRVGWLIR